MVADGHDVDPDALALQDDARSADRALADAAPAKAATDDDAFGILPALEREQPARDRGELAREVLDGPLDDARGLGRAFAQDHLEVLLAEPVRVLVAERIHPERAERLAPALQARHERVLAGAVPDEAAVPILQLDVVTIDLDGREPVAPVHQDGRVIAHDDGLPDVQTAVASQCFPSSVPGLDAAAVDPSARIAHDGPAAWTRRSLPS